MQPLTLPWKDRVAKFMLYQRAKSSLWFLRNICNFVSSLFWLQLLWTIKDLPNYSINSNVYQKFLSQSLLCNSSNVKSETINWLDVFLQHFKVTWISHWPTLLSALELGFQSCSSLEMWIDISGSKQGYIVLKSDPTYRISQLSLRQQRVALLCNSHSPIAKHVLHADEHQLQVLPLLCPQKHTS